MNSDTENQKNRIRFFQKTILSWFKENGRLYPWRNEKVPYRILIAEVMLQRTRADQVLPVYNEFIKQFPTVNSLAAANTDDVNRYVRKLGLFWRSKMISRMARFILKKHDGVIPAEREKLLEIPGVGDYIADAIISFAFNGKRTVIDANVVRLVTRFFGFKNEGETRRNRAFVSFCQTLSRDLRLRDVKKLNRAMIDHAAALCKPKPICVKCPLSGSCRYFNERGLIIKRHD